MTDILCHHVPCFMCGSDEYLVSSSGKDYEYATSDLEFSFTICRVCGHEYLNPRPVPECIPLTYPENYYTLEGRHTRNNSRIISRFKEWVIIRRLNHFKNILGSNSRILEIGCGDGSLLIGLKKRYPQLDIWGIDLALSRNTKETCRNAGIRLIEAPVEKTDLPKGYFDLIIMNQLIEHAEDPDVVINKCSNALKIGGYVSIETPNRKGYDRKFFSKTFWGGYYFPRHLHLFDKHSMTRLLERHGLGLEKHTCLLAPIIWTFSFHAFLTHGLEPGFRKTVVAWFFSDRNPLCLAVFTLVDLVARFIGLPTSNQKFIAKKG